MKSDLERRVDHVRYGRDKAASLVSGKPKSIAVPPSSSSSAPSESPADIIVKVVCKYRAELFFKVSRTTKLSKLFVAWTERMDTSGGVGGVGEKPKPAAGNGMTFLFSHHGRPLSPDRTADAYAIEDNDEILAVEMMDLTTDDVVCICNFSLISGRPDTDYFNRKKYPQIIANVYKNTGRTIHTSACTALILAVSSILTQYSNLTHSGRSELWKTYSMACKLTVFPPFSIC